MRAHRVLLLSAALVSVVLPSTVHARPRIPIFGAVLGAVGGVLGLRYYHHHHHQHAIASREHTGRVAARARRAWAPKTASKGERQPTVEGNAATSGQIAGATYVVWPNLPEDLADYVFRPSGTEDAFWSYGYAQVIDGAFEPLSSRPERISARSGHPSTTAVASGGAGAPGTCPGQQGAALADSLVGHLDHTIVPTEAQKSALEELRRAARHGFEYFDTSCPPDQARSLTSRLDAMEDRIWAARQALLILRAPIDKIYASLSDEQKARFNNGPAVPPDQREATCAKTTPELPLTQLGRGRHTRAAAEQSAGVDALKATSAALARTVSASCPSGTPPTPVGRLDLADKRLNALLYAVVTLRAPLDAFYASLNQAQESRPSASR